MTEAQRANACVHLESGDAGIHFEHVDKLLRFLHPKRSLGKIEQEVAHRFVGAKLLELLCSNESAQRAGEQGRDNQKSRCVSE